MTAVNGTWTPHRPRIVALLAATFVTTVSGCASPVLDPAPTARSVVVAAPAGADGELLAGIYAGVLRAAGTDATVTARTDIVDALAALDAGDVTLVPGYTGRLLHRYVPDATETDAEDVFDALARALPGDAVIADHAAAQDRAIMLTPGSGETVTDLAEVLSRCGEFTLVYTSGFEDAGGLDALDRAGCVPRASELSDGAGAAAAAADDGVLAGLTTTAPELSGQTPAAVVTLRDEPDRTEGEEADTQAPVFPAQNVVPVFRKDVLTDTQLDALRTVAGELSTADLADMLARVGAGEDARSVADEWLSEHAGG